MIDFEFDSVFLEDDFVEFDEDERDRQDFPEDLVEYD